MFPRKTAILAAVSLMVASSASIAQTNETSTPTRNISTIEDGRGSDLLVILGALGVAALLTFLATQIGGNDKPASP